MSTTGIVDKSKIGNAHPADYRRVYVWEMPVRAYHWINAIVMDSKGNIFTGEVEENKRIQKFVPVMANARR